MPLPETVLFDLDGTLSDSAPGILAALAHAFEVNGLPPLEPRTARRCSRT
jgi:phosphoglycolate phosphatase